MERENIIEKVRALRNLAENKSATIEEAATAARMAELIIQKHALAEAELLVNDSNDAKEEIIEDSAPLTDWKKRATNWQGSLIKGLSDIYGCEVLILYKNGTPNVYAIGRKSDIEMLRYQYTFFMVELIRLANNLAPNNLGRGSGKTWYNSFYRGGISSIIESLRAAKKEVRQQASSSALVFIDQKAKEIQEFMKKSHPHLRTKSSYSNIDPDAYNKGKQAGANLNPKPGLAPGVKGLLK